MLPDLDGERYPAHERPSGVRGGEGEPKGHSVSQ